MYVPRHFAAEPSDIHQLLHAAPVSELVVYNDGLSASTLPLLFDPSIGEHGTLLGHVARTNPIHQGADGAEALAIIRDVDDYISPSWYASKKEHGRTVPTWNYIVVHAHGRLIVHDDPAWCEDLVRRLTHHHERSRSEPWSVDDAPPAFIQGQLRAIIGIELRIERLEGKFKLSQNRSTADREGVIAGLGDAPTATAMRAALP